MKIPGIIGGLGPKATLDYYRKTMDVYRTRTGDGSDPSLLLNSVDMQHMVRLLTAGQLDELVAFLLAEVTRLARAGADFGLLSANTPHAVFPQLQAKSPTSAEPNCCCSFAASRIPASPFSIRRSYTSTRSSSGCWAEIAS